MFPLWQRRRCPPSSWPCVEPGDVGPFSVTGLRAAARLVKRLAVTARLFHELCHSCEGVMKLRLGSLGTYVSVFIRSRGGVGCTGARPVYAAPRGSLQHLQAQSARAPQGRLQPGLICHEPVATGCTRWGSLPCVVTTTVLSPRHRRNLLTDLDHILRS